MEKKKDKKTCRNCEEVFSEKEKPIIVKGLAFEFKVCKKCWKKIVERCHTCEWPIYKNDLIYEISVSRGADYFVNASENEKKIQCSSCYNDWLRKQKKKRWIKWGLMLFLTTCVIKLLFLALPIFYPKLKDNWEKLCQCNQWTLIGLLFIIPIVTTYLVTQEFSSRYEVRERRV